MNPKLATLSGSINVELSNRVREIEANGEKVLKLQTGEPDFETPKVIIESAHQAMKSGSTHYCASSGVSELKEVIAEKLASQNKIASSKENVLVSHGAVHAFYLVSQSILAEKDEVIIISPYWMPYKSCVELAGATPVVIDSSSYHFALPLDAIEQAITSKTKAIIINSPNNPSGVIYDKEALTQLIEMSKKHGIYIISDEVYEDICFSKEHHSVAALADDNERIVSIFSLSKGYAMTGWRIGYIHASTELINTFNKLAQYTVTSICHFTQIAAITALTSSEAANEKQAMKNEYSHRRGAILAHIKGTWLEEKLVVPQGAFYCLIDVSSFTDDSAEFARKLLSEYKVCFTPGEAFGLIDTPHIRMTFATDLNTIIKALDILITVGG